MATAFGKTLNSRATSVSIQKVNHDGTVEIGAPVVAQVKQGKWTAELDTSTVKDQYEITETHPEGTDVRFARVYKTGRRVSASSTLLDSSTLNDLADVDLAEPPADEEVMAFDEEADAWIPRAVAELVASGGIQEIPAIPTAQDITDVLVAYGLATQAVA